MSDERPLETGWLADTPIQDTLFRRFLHNQADLNAEVATAAGGRVDQTADVALADTGSAIPFLNEAVLLRPLTGAGDTVLDRIEAFYAPSSAEGRMAVLLSMWPTPDLTARGWFLVGHPAFVVRAPAAYTHTVAAGVDVRTAATADDLVTAERIGIEGYPLPEAAGDAPGSIFPPGLLGGEAVFRLGLLDGVPVGAAGRYAAHGVLNLSFAATLPAAGSVGGAGLGPSGRRPRSTCRRLHQRRQPPRLRAHGLPAHHPLHPLGPLNPTPPLANSLQ